MVKVDNWKYVAKIVKVEELPYTLPPPYANDPMETPRRTPTRDCTPLSLNTFPTHLSFLPEVREFITRHTAYNKHDTGWAKGAPSEDHTTPPSSRTASGDRLVGGAPAGARPFRGWLIPRVPYSGLVPYWEQTAIPATRPREGDVC